MKRIIILGIMILGILSCGKKLDENGIDRSNMDKNQFTKLGTKYERVEDIMNCINIKIDTPYNVKYPELNDAPEYTGIRSKDSHEGKMYVIHADKCTFTMSGEEYFDVTIYYNHDTYREGDLSLPLGILNNKFHMSIVGIQNDAVGIPADIFKSKVSTDKYKEHPYFIVYGTPVKASLPDYNGSTMEHEEDLLGDTAFIDGNATINVPSESSQKELEPFSDEEDVEGDPLVDKNGNPINLGIESADVPLPGNFDDVNMMARHAIATSKEKK